MMKNQLDKPSPDVPYSPPQNDLPSLSETVEAHGLGAKKNLGQHFLLDMNITRKIARLSAAKEGEHIIEVGPGPGGLTRALLETGANLTVIERDERCLEILHQLQQAWPGKLSILSDDALKIDYTKFNQSEKPTKFVSNLPYNISTELLVRWLTMPQNSWVQMTLMFQREVADRILANHGSKTYGRLSVLSQSAAQPVRGYDLPARAFTPPPKIDSSVVLFTPKNFAHLKNLEAISKAAFSMRRKMVRTTLKPVFGDKLDEIVKEAGLLPTARAEEIDIEKFEKLAALAATLS